VGSYPAVLLCAKFALHGISEALRVELHDSGIAVSIINPAATQTGLGTAFDTVM
jgi:short-subunit dehydrogenase